MRWNDGRSAWARRAKSPFGEAPLYSKSTPSLTPKLICDGCVRTPSWVRRRSKLG